MLKVTIRKQHLDKLAEIAPVIKTQELLAEGFITATIDTDMTSAAFWKMWNKD